ncbi:MAG: ABC transporter permease [Acidobacteriota bacterium]
MEWRKIWAFVVRDFLNEVSYRFGFFLQFGGSFLSAFTWYVISQIVQPGSLRVAEVGEGGYFSFVLVGLAFHLYLQSSLGAFASKIRQEQLTGTLEALLATPTRVSIIILASSVWDFVVASMRVLVYLLFGVFLGVKIIWSNGAPALLVLALTIVSFSSIGILSASLILYFKRGDPLNFLIVSTHTLLGGVLFPTELLQRWPWVAWLSDVLPLTYALRAVRRTLLAGAPLSDIANELMVLLLFAVLLLPASLLAFRFALAKARQEGSLVHY